MITFLNNGKGGTDTSDATATVNDILDPKVAYAKGERIIGMMPNNGSLEYTPSENEQSIPLGYTSGGIIKPADITKLKDYEKCYDLAQTILSGATIPAKGLVYNFIDSNFMFDKTIIDTGVTQASLISGYTFIARIYPTQYNNHRGLFGLHSSGGIVGLQYEDGKLSYGHVNTKVSGYIDSSKLPINNWGIFVATYDGSVLKCYVNKEENFSVEGNAFTPYGNVIIGEAFDSDDRFYAGCMSNFMIYNRSLTEEELEEVYNFLEVTNTNTDINITYTELEYLLNPNGACIDTGIKNVDYCKTELKLQGIETKNQRFFGFNYSNYHMCWWDNKWYYGSDSNNTTDHFFTCNSTITDLCKIIYNNENNKISVNGEEFGNKSDVVSNSRNNSIYIFKECENTEKYYGKLYYFKMTNKQTGQTIIDLIPAKDNYGRVGMYDKVSKKLFTSVTSAKFVPGPEIGKIKEA